VGIVCGKGNNGGDGFVAARHALLAGLETEVLLLADPAHIAGDAALYMDVYRKLGGVIQVATNETDVIASLTVWSDHGTVIDAILGTGSQGALSGLPRAAVGSWPKVFTISVDVPTGLNADTGETAGLCIHADITVAIQYAKRGYTVSAAAPYLGRLIVADIGIPPCCADNDAWEQVVTRL
jgi:NAD(P)H-hydrate epimerase